MKGTGNNMPFDAAYASEFLSAFSFERIGGTPSETKAVRLIEAAAQRLGAACRRESFRIHTYTGGAAGLEILEPYRKCYAVRPVRLSGRLPKGGLVADLEFLGIRHPASVGGLRGKAVYGYNLFPPAHLERFRNTGVAALLDVFHYGRPLRTRCIPELVRRRVGRIPMLSLPYEAGVEMVRRRAARARIVLDQGEREAHSVNVLAEVPGTDSDEELLICAHHDSVPDSPGAQDNGGGAAVLLGLLKHFVKHPTRRALRFVWFGSEEQGLFGSREYVRRHARALAKIRMVVNIDGIGRLIDTQNAVVTGPDGLRAFVDVLAREHGLDYPVTDGAYGSDGIPFSWHAIPSINLTGGADYNLLGHTAHDGFEWCGPEGLAPTGALALEIVRRLGDARAFPFPRGFIDSTAAALKDYYTKLPLPGGRLPAWCR